MRDDATFTEQPEGSCHDPFLRLRLDDAQRLMNELWDCGLRPSEGTGSAGSLKATEKHLADMQRIAFMLLERPNVEVQGREAALAPRSVPLERSVGREEELG